MPLTASVAMSTTPLTHWLRLLWNISPPLNTGSDLPFIAEGRIHLPACTNWHGHRAAAAHAAAHLVYSPTTFDGAGLVPIARAVMAMLEDARVEALAMRELPGLSRLWRPHHVATPALGSTFEALLERLARALIDPDYEDPDAWVRKGRDLFHSDLALNPAGIKTIALRLGHDIGQMRLQFNVKTYRTAPAYRDDSRWMWSADLLGAASPPKTSGASRAQDDEIAPSVDGESIVVRYPEWDRLISRHRVGWCTVVQHLATTPKVSVAHDDSFMRESVRRLRVPLRSLKTAFAPRRRPEEGETFDIDALIDRQVGRRMRSTAAMPVYRGPDPREERTAVCILIDQSASTAGLCKSGGQTILEFATATAGAAGAALDGEGVPCIIAGFSSHGRHDVRVTLVKPFDKVFDRSVGLRLHSLRARGSTRLGAALRHASSQIANRSSGSSWVILISDGEPHDIDVHDSRYLVEDARDAVNTAARAGVRIGCLVAGNGRGEDVRRIFGRSGVQTVNELDEVPRAIRRLLA
ncbi:MAG: hypothetical protein JWN94_378 [Betaproteobacteria bacterium]|nr:hypothetical protein [Betaproteobacteria bacterium]